MNAATFAALASSSFLVSHANPSGTVSSHGVGEPGQRFHTYYIDAPKVTIKEYVIHPELPRFATAELQRKCRDLPA